MKCIIYRGSSEIGGSALLVEVNECRIVIDMGMPLVDKDGERFDMNRYRDLQVRELCSLGILPDIEGLYEEGEKGIDAVLISHAHQDHYGFLRYKRKDIPVYMGEASRRLVEMSGEFSPEKTGDFLFKPFSSGHRFQIGAFHITPFLMDHSAFDAYAFVVEGGGKTIIYSGDFREHGRKKKAYTYFLAKAPRKAAALFLEGTMFGREDEKTFTEDDLEKEAAAIMKESKRAVLVCTSSQNIDRLVTLYRASIRAGRLFCIDFYTAYILSELRRFAALPYPSEEFDTVRVFYPKRLSDFIMKKGNPEIMYRFKAFKVTKEEMGSNAGRIVMCIRSSMAGDLDFIQGMEEADFIYSMWKGYCEYESMQPLLEKVKAYNMKYHYLHTSGHAYFETLKKTVDTLQPEVVIPIHTFHPGEYQRLGVPVRMCKDLEVIDLDT